MNIIKYFLVSVMVALIATPAFSSMQASKKSNARGYTHKMCDAETTSGVCDSSGGEDYYAIVDRYESMTFYFYEGSAGANSCDVFVADHYTAIADDLSTMAGAKINSTSLDSTTDRISISGPFYAVWVSCTVATDVTVYVQGAEGKLRNSR